MKAKKMPFFVKFKRAIFNFDAYRDFSEEKTSDTVKYILKIVLVFSLIVAISLGYKIVQKFNNMISDFKKEFPQFSFKDNILNIEGDNKKIVKGDENGLFGFIVDGKKEKVADIPEAGDYQMIIAVLKDKIIIRDVNGTETTATYEQLSKRYDLVNINKDVLLQYFSRNDMVKIYTISMTVIFVYLYIMLLLHYLLHSLLLSVVGYLLSKIVNVKLKYKSVYKLAIYSLTFPFVLYVLYMLVTVFTSFDIKYFDIAYNAIAYIYMITAILTIKSDLIKQQMEIGQIVEVQKKVRKEEQQGEDRKKESQKEEKEKDKKEDKQEEDKKEHKKREGEAPAGNKA